MQINLTELFSHTTNEIDVIRELDLNDIKFGDDAYQVLGPTKVEFKLTKFAAKDYLIQGKIVITLDLVCSRCMDNVSEKLETNFSKKLRMNDVAQEDYDENDESHEYIEGHILDLEKLVLDEVYMNIPMKVLCRESCEGICKTCGVNLNHTTCSCEDDNYDPRLAGLRDLFNERF